MNCVDISLDIILLLKRNKQNKQANKQKHTRNTKKHQQNKNKFNKSTIDNNTTKQSKKKET